MKKRILAGIGAGIILLLPGTSWVFSGFMEKGDLAVYATFLRFIFFVECFVGAVVAVIFLGAYALGEE